MRVAPRPMKSRPEIDGPGAWSVPLNDTVALPRLPSDLRPQSMARLQTDPERSCVAHPFAPNEREPTGSIERSKRERPGCGEQQWASRPEAEFAPERINDQSSIVDRTTDMGGWSLPLRHQLLTGFTSPVDCLSRNLSLTSAQLLATLIRTAHSSFNRVRSSLLARTDNQKVRAFASLAFRAPFHAREKHQGNGADRVQRTSHRRRREVSQLERRPRIARSACFDQGPCAAAGGIERQR